MLKHRDKETVDKKGKGLVEPEDIAIKECDNGLLVFPKVATTKENEWKMVRRNKWRRGVMSKSPDCCTSSIDRMEKGCIIGLGDVGRSHGSP